MKVVGRSLWLTLLALLPAVGAAQSEESEAPEALVTKDGERIEVRGGWEEKGSRLVFEDARGRLRSLRRDAIDFEATLREAAPAPRALLTAPARAAEPVLVLDQTNTRAYEAVAAPAPPAAAAAAPDGAAGDPGTTTGEARAAASSGDVGAAPAGPALEVVSWDNHGSEEEGEAGTDIWGTIQNNGRVLAEGVRVEVRLLADDESLLANETVAAHRAAIAPGGTANFNAEFEAVIPFTRIEFNVLDAASEP